MIVEFNCAIKKFGEQGEKTGWTYIEVPKAIAQQLVPGNKKSFRVKGCLDEFTFQSFALIPMGGGDFILPLKADVRKKIGKGKGAKLRVQMEVDKSPVTLSQDLLECLSDEPEALAFFYKLPRSHQNYYSRWIESAKSEETKAKRIAQTLVACSRQQKYNEMIRSVKAERKDLLP